MLKRGLSSIVATVLIVLLSLAAIAIVWGFVGPMIKSGGERASIASKCLNVELKPINCIVNINGTKKLEKAIIKLERGEAETMRVAIRDAGGKVNLTAQRNAPANVVETVSIEENLTLPNLGAGPYQITVVPSFTTESGKEEFCEESTIKITCQEIA
mgnify:CR=1 FL=1